MESRLATLYSDWDFDLFLGVAEGLVELSQCQVAVSLPLPNTHHNPSLFTVMANWLSIGVKYNFVSGNIEKITTESKNKVVETKNKVETVKSKRVN